MKKLFFTLALLETACFASEINHENLGTTNNPTQNIEQNITTNGNIQENDIDKKLTNEFCNKIIREAISEDHKMNIEQHMTKTQKVLDKILSFAQNSNNISKTVTKAFSDSIETIFNPKSDYDQYKLKGNLVNALLPKKKQIKFRNENIDNKNIRNKINQKYDELSKKINFLLFQCYIEDCIYNLKTIKDIEDIIENVIFYAESIKLFNEGIDKKVQRNEYKNINHILVLYAGLRSEYAYKIMQAIESQTQYLKNFTKKKYYLNVLMLQLYSFVFWSETFLYYTLLHDHETDYTQEYYNDFIYKIFNNLDNGTKEGAYCCLFGNDGRMYTYSYLLCYDFNTLENLLLPSTDFCNINDDNIDDNTCYGMHKPYTTHVKISEINKKINELYTKINEKQTSGNIIDNIILKRGKIILKRLKKITNEANEKLASQNNQQTQQNQGQRNVSQRPQTQNNAQTQQNQRQQNVEQRPQSQNNAQTQQNQTQQNVATMPQSQNNQQNVTTMPQSQNNPLLGLSYEQLLELNQYMKRTLQSLANMIQARNNIIDNTSSNLSAEITGIKRIIDSDDAQETQRRNTEGNENHQN